MKKFKKFSALLLVFGGIFFFPIKCAPDKEKFTQTTVDQQTEMNVIQAVNLNELQYFLI